MSLRILLLASLLSLSFLHAQSEADLKPFQLPTSEAGLLGEGELRRYDAYVQRWPEFRERWSRQKEADQGAIVFLGDSITQGWGQEFRGLFPRRKLANRGIGGDTTRGMLIRLEEDVLSLNPEAIVILAGTNDLEVGISPEAASRNLRLMLDLVKGHDPELPVMLCQTFPSAAERDRPQDKIKRLNQLYTDVAADFPQVKVVDTWTLFAAENGDADPKWFKDMLHLNTEGYQRWAAFLRKELAEMLD